MTISMFIAGCAFAFATGWLMSLVVIASIPAMLFAGIFYMKALG